MRALLLAVNEEDTEIMPILGRVTGLKWLVLVATQNYALNDRFALRRCGGHFGDSRRPSPPPLPSSCLMIFKVRP